MTVPYGYDAHTNSFEKPVSRTSHGARSPVGRRVSMPRTASEPHISSARQRPPVTWYDDEDELYRVDANTHDANARVLRAAARFDARAQGSVASSSAAGGRAERGSMHEDDNISAHTFGSESMSPPLLSSEGHTDDGVELSELQQAVYAQFAARYLEDHTCEGHLQAFFVASRTREAGPVTHVTWALYGGPHHAINGAHTLDGADRAPPHLARRAPLTTSALLRRSELRGLISVLAHILRAPPSPGCVHVCVSSDYVAKAWGTWIPNWELHGWPGEDDGRSGQLRPRSRTPSRSSDGSVPSTPTRRRVRSGSVAGDSDSFSTSSLSYRSDSSCPSMTDVSSQSSPRRSSRRLVDEDLLRELAQARADLAELHMRGGAAVRLYQIRQEHNPADAWAHAMLLEDLDATPRVPTGAFQAMYIASAPPQPEEEPRSRRAGPSPAARRDPERVARTPPRSILRAPQDAVEPLRMFSPPRRRAREASAVSARAMVGSPVPDDVLTRLPNPTSPTSHVRASPARASPRTAGPAVSRKDGILRQDQVATPPYDGPSPGPAARDSVPRLSSPALASWASPTSPVSGKGSPRRPGPLRTRSSDAVSSGARTARSVSFSDAPPGGASAQLQAPPILSSEAPPPLPPKSPLTTDAAPSTALTAAALRAHTEQAGGPEAHSPTSRRRARSSKSSAKSESASSLLQKLNPRNWRRDGAGNAVPPVPVAPHSAEDRAPPAWDLEQQHAAWLQRHAELQRREAALARRERDMEDRQRSVREDTRAPSAASAVSAASTPSRAVSASRAPAAADATAAPAAAAASASPPPKTAGRGLAPAPPLVSAPKSGARSPTPTGNELAADDDAWLWESNLRRPKHLPLAETSDEPAQAVRGPSRATSPVGLAGYGRRPRRPPSDSSDDDAPSHGRRAASRSGTSLYTRSRGASRAASPVQSRHTSSRRPSNVGLLPLDDAF